MDLAATDDPTSRPIGWWLKAADAAITAGADRVLAAHGLTRSTWMVLHTVRQDGPLPRATLADAVAPFADRAPVDATLTALASTGWIAEGDDGWATTAAGTDAHDAAWAAVGAYRARTVEGIDADAYRTTVAALSRLVANAGDPGPSPGPGATAPS
jgi:hypothetical protein